MFFSLKYSLIALVLILFSSINSTSFAAAWLQEEGEIQLITPVIYKNYSEFFNKNGEKQNSFSFKKIEFLPSIEYGWTKNTTLGMLLSIENVSKREADNTTLKETELTYARIYLRKQLYKDTNSVFSSQLLLKIPGIYSNSKEYLMNQKQFDTEIRFLYGYSFNIPSINFIKDKYHFFNIELAYKKRFETPSDQILLDATLGTRIYKDFLFLLQVFSTFSNNSTINENNFINNTTSYDLIDLSFSIVKPITKKHSLEISTYQSIWGRQTGIAKGVKIAIWSSF